MRSQLGKKINYASSIVLLLMHRARDGRDNDCQDAKEMCHAIAVKD